MKLVKSLIRKMKWLKRKVNVETNLRFSGRNLHSTFSKVYE